MQEIIATIETAGSAAEWLALAQGLGIFAAALLVYAYVTGEW
jgi:hypothetical protein